MAISFQGRAKSDATRWRRALAKGRRIACLLSMGPEAERPQKKKSDKATAADGGSGSGDVGSATTGADAAD